MPQLNGFEVAGSDLCRVSIGYVYEVVAFEGSDFSAARLRATAFA